MLIINLKLIQKQEKKKHFELSCLILCVWRNGDSHGRTWTGAFLCIFSFFLFTLKENGWTLEQWWSYSPFLFHYVMFQQPMGAYALPTLLSTICILNLLSCFRVIRRLRDHLNPSICRTRPLQWRRSFGRPGSLPQDVIAARKLQWRARCSIVKLNFL